MLKNYSLSEYPLSIDLIPDVVFIKDINGVIIHANKRFIEFINKKEEDIIGKTDFDFFVEETAKSVTQKDNLVIDNKTTNTFNELIKKNDDVYYFETTKSPIFNDKNEVIAIFCIAKDITKQKNLEIIKNDTKILLEYIAKEVDLNKTLNKIVTLAESKNLNIKCSILLLDDTKNRLYSACAPSLPEFYNKAIDGIEIGDKVGSCGSAAYNKKRVIIDNIDTHENWSTVLDLTTKANLHSCWSEPILISNNEVVGTFAMYSNYHKKPSSFEITLIETYAYISSIAIEKNNSLKKFLKQEKIIYEQTKLVSMGEMIGNISHQWRQPLSVISSGVTGMLLLNKYNNLTSEEFEKVCNTINDNAQYLSKTIDDFTNFIKNDRKLIKFDINSTINSFLNLIEPSLKKYEIKLIRNNKIFIDLEGYPNELIQCFMNIFNNTKDALKNSQYNEKYLFIELFKSDSNIIIKFKDNAGGIKEDILPKIFEPYFTTKYQSKGTGLGLSIIYNLITKGMQGFVSAQNVNFEYNGSFYKGAEFIITLPLSYSQK